MLFAVAPTGDEPSDDGASDRPSSMICEESIPIEDDRTAEILGALSADTEEALRRRLASADVDLGLPPDVGSELRRRLTNGDPVVEIVRWLKQQAPGEK